MSAFIRRFLTNPGLAILLNIESVNILDFDPPANITGVQSNANLIVGEFENGAFETPTEVASAGDLMSVFGNFGYVRNGVPANDPCARARKSDGAITNEFWNGNGMVQLSGKKFGRLFVVRVDTSVGSVQFDRLASIVSSVGAQRFALDNGQTFIVDIGAGNVTATFVAAVATVTGTGATFGSIAAGDSVVLGFDDSPDITVTFQAGDTVIANVVTRINNAVGYSMASNSAGQVKLDGRRKGTGGKVRVVSGSGTTLTKLGLTAATTAGTGDAADITSATFTEVKTRIETSITNTRVEQLSNGKIRIAKSTATGSITYSGTSTATALGFTAGQTNTYTSGNAGIIPAGTRIKTAGGNIFLTMQDLSILAATSGAYTVKVRHATDDGTGVTATAATVVQFTDTIDLDAFSVTNPSDLSAALTEAQIDAKYVSAFASTLSVEFVTAQTNMCFSARQSNMCRRTVRQNCLDASANGLYGRIGFIRCPMNTPKATAKGNIEPGVGAYRDQRVIYCYPNVKTYIPGIATRGTAGGTGFTADGYVDVGFDGFVASICSQLPPEENPGQATTFLTAIGGIESAFATTTLDINDYIAFKAAGIAAYRNDSSTGTCVQSGVTSVDPAVYPQLVTIQRRRMADFIQDSLALRLKSYSKKLSIQVRRKAILGEIRAFASDLLSQSNPANQRIAGYTVDETGNTPTTLAAGLYYINAAFRILPSLLSITLGVTAGENVSVTELAAA